MIDFMENHSIVPAFVPVANALAGGITTEVVSLENYSQATLIVNTGAYQDTGVSNLVKIVASTDTTASGTNMAFRWRAMPYTTSVDLWTTLTAVGSGGYNFSVNQTASDGLWYATVTAEEVAAALTDAKFVFASIAQTADKTITAGGIWILSDPRYSQDIPPTVIV